jgi:hypothetical protein
MYTGPNIERDGLVFGYDTGANPSSNFDSRSTQRRHFKGKPVINRVNYGDDFSSWTTARNSGSYPTIDSKVAKGPFNGTKADRLSLPSDGSYPRIYQNFTPTTTATHTFSIWLKGETDGQGCFIGCFRNYPWSGRSSFTTTITTEWKHYSFDVNPADLTAHQMYIGSHNSHGGKVFLMYGAQLEVGTVASPFNVSSRSSTQSLIDLTKLTNIDVSNVSFNSDGLPTFDGTDDIINTGLFSGRNPSTSPFTVEAIIKSDVTSGNRMWLDATSNGSNQRFYSALDDGGGNPIGIQGSAWSDSIPSTADYIHQTIVMDGSTARSYRNGVASFTKSYTSYTLAGPITIGGRAGYKWIGQIPVVKIYDRALSAPEVKQNFNAYKNRFDI